MANVSSNNLTTLYSGSGVSVRPTSAYGNSNVVSLLNAGTDGGNTITNIVATGNVTADYFIGNFVGNATNANYANFAGTAFSVAGANVTGTVANATYALSAGSANTAANATHSNVADLANSVSVANVIGIGNIAVINLDGNVSNILHGNGYWGPESGNLNANYANYAGNVTIASQPNITSVGNLIDLRVENDNLHLGTNAGVTSQGAYGVAFGYLAGRTTQGTRAIAIGTEAGVTTQGANSIAIGSNAGKINTAPETVSLGTYAGWDSQKQGAIAIGTGAGMQLQGVNSVAIGVNAGNNSLGNNSIILNATGLNLNQTTPNTFTVKPVRNANTSNLMFYNNSTGEITYDLVSNVVSNNANYANFAGNVTNSAQPNITSLGTLTSLSVSGNLDTGNANLGNLAIANYFSGSGNLLSNIQAGNISGTVANANYAGYAGNVTIAAQPNITSVGTLTGLISNGIVDFTNASNVSLGSNGNIHISGGAANYALITDGSGNLSWGQVANAANANYANFAGNLINGTSNVNTNGSGGNINISVGGTSNVVVVSSTTAIVANLQVNSSNVTLGANAGFTPQGSNSVAIGANAANNNQYSFAIAIGNSAGGGYQGNRAIAIGDIAGTLSQKDYAIAIGYNAGIASQNSNAVAIGSGAGATNQAENAIAIGLRSGYGVSTAQGNSSIAVGAYAGYNNQANNSIILNATGSALDQTTANTFTVKPVRQANTSNIMYYDNSTGEITYDVATSITANSANFANYAGNVTVATQGNITSLGNLINLTVSNGVSNTRSPTLQVTPNLITWGNATLGSTFMSVVDYGSQAANGAASNFTFVKARGNSASIAAAANNDQTMRLMSTVYNGNTYARSTAIVTLAPQAANANFQYANTVWTPGQFNMVTGNPLGNVYSLTASSPQNVLTLNQYGQLSLIPGTYTNIAGGNGSFIAYSFGSNSDGSGAGATFGSTRARGNRDSFQAVQNGDVIGGYLTAAYNGSIFGGAGSVLTTVDTTYGAVTSGSNFTPARLAISVSSNTTTYTTTFGGDGNVTFPNYLSYTRTYGDFYNSSTITPAAANTPAVLPLGTAGTANNCSIQSTSQLLISRVGNYNMQFSLQAVNADNAAEHDFVVWLRKNGSDVTNSATEYTVIKNNGKNVAMLSFNVSSNGSDYFEIAYSVADTQITFPAYAANSFGYTHPAVPSLIVNLIPIGA